MIHSNRLICNADYGLFCIGIIVCRQIRGIILFTFYSIISIGVFGQQTNIDSLNELLIGTRNGKDRVDLLNQISRRSNLLFAFKNPPIAEGKLYAEEALRIAQAMDYKIGEAEALYNLGIYYSKDSIDVEKMRKNYFGAADIYFSLSDSLQYVKCLLRVSNFYAHHNTYTYAIPINFRIIQSIPKNEKYLSETANILSSVYQLQGTICLISNQYDCAHYNILKSIEISKKQGKLNDYLTTSMLRALVFLRQKNLGEAETELQKVYSEFQSSDKSAWWIPIYWYNPILAEIYAEKMKYDSALYFLDQSEYLSDSLGKSSNNNYLRGKIKLQQGYFDEAEKLLNSDSVNPEDLYDTKSELKRTLAVLSEKRGDFPSAIRYYKESFDLLDNVNWQLNDFERLLRTEHHEYEKRLIQSELLHEQQQKKLILLSSIIVVVLVIIIILIVGKSRNKINERNMILGKLLENREHLISVLAHDVRAPLNNIRSLNSLKKYSSPDELSSIEDKISDCINSTIGLLNNILSWSAAQLSGKTASVDEVKVKEIVMDVHNTYQHIASQKGLVFSTIHATNGELIVHSDGAIIHLVLRNLVNNAIKFTPSGRVTIQWEEQEPDKILFKVIDTGPGLAEDKFNNLLRGYGAGSRTLGSNHEPGSGLGLMICQTFLNKLGSRLFYKRDNSESVFYFFITNET